MKTWLNQEEDIIEHDYEFYNWQHVTNTFYQLQRFAQCPNIAKLARRYLATPISSVYSERLFSEMGQVYEVMKDICILVQTEMTAKMIKKSKYLALRKIRNLYFCRNFF